MIKTAGFKIILVSLALLLLGQVAQAAKICSNDYLLKENLCNDVRCTLSRQCESGNCIRPHLDYYGLCASASITLVNLVLILLASIVVTVGLCVVGCCFCCKLRKRKLEKQLDMQNQDGGYPGAQMTGYQPIPQQAYQ